mmetsp:Transcript_61809/g.175559  ORF Transcript_61809/g.175559 Transcript_61809/m.175559 type:complete len:236 (-) Transcript_61809:438-1145(-)
MVVRAGLAASARTPTDTLLAWLLPDVRQTPAALLGAGDGTHGLAGHLRHLWCVRRADARGAAAGAHALLRGRLLGYRALLGRRLHSRARGRDAFLLRVTELLEIGILEGLSRENSLVGVVPDEFLHQFNKIRICVRNESLDARSLLVGEIEVHVRCIPFELPTQELRIRCPEHVVDLLDLVHLVLAREEREEGHGLEPDAAGGEEVHLEVVVAIRQQALGRTVPPCADVLGVGLT